MPPLAHLAADGNLRKRRRERERERESGVVLEHSHGVVVIVVVILITHSVPGTIVVVVVVVVSSNHIKKKKKKKKKGCRENVLPKENKREKSFLAGGRVIQYSSRVGTPHDAPADDRSPPGRASRRP